MDSDDTPEPQEWSMPEDWDGDEPAPHHTHTQAWQHWHQHRAPQAAMQPPPAPWNPPEYLWVRGLLIDAVQTLDTGGLLRDGADPYHLAARLRALADRIDRTKTRHLEAA